MLDTRLGPPGRPRREPARLRAAVLLLTVALAGPVPAFAQAPDPDGALVASPGAVLLPAQPIPPGTPVLLGDQPLPTFAAPAEPVLAGPRPRCEMLPLQRLWQQPLASPRAPRSYVKQTTLDEWYTSDTIDTAIGAVAGIARYNPPDSDGAFQFDIFAVHFSRWRDRSHAVVSDYRYGILPFTWASEGPAGNGWQAKLGYEHTSTHLGDDYIAAWNRYKVRYVRDEVVFGLAYRWFNQLRLYGEAAYAFSMAATNQNGRERFEWGLEWSKQCPTGWRGQPFAAFDMDLRPEQDWEPNMCLQLGWQWIPTHQALSFRFAAELYHGYAPYGQIYLTREEWAGLGLYLDF